MFPLKFHLIPYLRISMSDFCTLVVFLIATFLLLHTLTLSIALFAQKVLSLLPIMESS